ncbi:response regulator [Taibaiella soli]|uniref:DNA-binding response regulator n=1 Tax=Taibaiella soli TaxID=1649169 RepID=A0A2W2AR05_9BACT|nr:response regulator transcription factor [Taibaiella soli]PZF74870.1 DNA-binding response regulator [Taibaiella soli]
MSTNILIADDHGIVRAGIKTILKDHIATDNVHEAASETEVITLVKSNFYDALLLDINMPGTDFASLMQWLTTTTPDTAVIIFSMYTEDIYGKRCLQLGAKGFLHKTASDTEIVHAFRKVLNGEHYINTALRKILQERETEEQSQNPFDNLSSRELEIARLIQKGHRLPEICGILNIQYSTANTYKRRIFEKLNVPTAVALSHLMQTFQISS